MAYSYDRPSVGARNILRSTDLVVHHNDYKLIDAFLLPQNEPGEVTIHTFTLFPKVGCHNIYYAFFDGHDPQAAHSISPIFALTYCAIGGDAPQVGLYDYPAHPNPFSAPFWAVIVDVRASLAPLTPLTGTNVQIFPLTALDNYQTHVHLNNPPICTIFTTSNNGIASYLAYIEDDSYSFNHAFIGPAIKGPPAPPFLPALSYARIDGLFVCGFSTNYSFQALNPPATGYTTTATLRASGSGGSLGIDPPYPFTFDSHLEGPGPAPNFTDFISNGDNKADCVSATWPGGTQVISLGNITKNWRHLPAEPVP
jgi:hypothetical protein